MKKKQNILAIDPGTRYIGFALLDMGELVHYGVKTISKMKSSNETLMRGRKIILRLINDFQPQVLVVEKTFFANNKDSVLLNTFVKQIQAVGKKRGLKVMSIATNTVRKVICGNGAASKEEVARAIVSRFSELQPYLTSNMRWKERFHQNMFDAVALGVACKTE